MDSTNIIKLRLIGLDVDNGDIRLDIFLRQLESLKETLIQIDKRLAGKEKITAYYKVVDLQHSSPAMIAVQPVPTEEDQDLSEEIVKKFYKGVQGITKGDDVSSELGYDTIECIKKLIDPVGKALKSMTLISADNYNIELDEKVVELTGPLTVPSRKTFGSIVGRLEAINLHDGANRFTVYPSVGPSRVICHFGADIKDEVVAVLDNTVHISGDLLYRGDEPFPSKVEVKTIEIAHSGGAAHLLSLYGTVPDATGDMASEDFTRMIRNEW